MAMSDKERKRRQREKQQSLGVKPLVLELTHVERCLVRVSASIAGYDNQTEYLLDLVRKDRDTSQQQISDCPDCRGRGCFTCCSSEAEIRDRDKGNQVRRNMEAEVARMENSNSEHNHSDRSGGIK